MKMNYRITEFIKVYLVFLVSALLVNVSMELLIGNPGWGIVVFYMLFSIAGTAIYLVARYRAWTMGILSLIGGTICELSFMQPDFLRDLFAFRFSPRLALTMLITIVYWFLAWAVPAYIIRKYFSKWISE